MGLQSRQESSAGARTWCPHMPLSTPTPVACDCEGLCCGPVLSHHHPRAVPVPVTHFSHHRKRSKGLSCRPFLTVIPPQATKTGSFPITDFKRGVDLNLGSTDQRHFLSCSGVLVTFFEI